MTVAFGRPSRRSVLGALAALPALGSARADGEASPVAHGVLKDNKLAQAFEPAPGELPDVAVIGPHGERGILELLKGRTVLMPIWAEWCAPCLTELPDFARLQEVYGKAKFAIVPVLSGARHLMTPDAVAQLFESLNAGIFEPLIELHYGDTLARTMGGKAGHILIPCNVLIGPDGKVIGREFGLAPNRDDDGGGESGNDAIARIRKAASGDTQSLWGTSAGDEFAVAMSIGFFR